MSEYQAPAKDMLFAIRELAGLEQLNKMSGFEEATSDMVEAILEEAGQLASEVVAPLNRIGDATGTRVEAGRVIVPDEFKPVYQQFVSDGWAGISQSAEHGGQGLPYLVGLAVEEMMQAACLSWSLCTLLTQGAARAVESHGDAELQARVLDKMISGEWSGTMNLTEPQAGSDLAAVRTQAVPVGDGFSVTGQKIFITWGDHDMADNIIHLVLARLPDAPEGVRGLSLFAVPKFLINADGSVGERNGVTAVSVEHKLGIHGSPTCVLAFDAASGYLLGELNNGLVSMFTMMNHARLSVGLEGVAISERAYQQARAFAKERVQGHKAGHQGAVTIIKHPDVRRMLMYMKAHIEAMRGIAYVAAAHLDYAHHHADETVRADSLARVELLTPIVKGWCTEVAQELTSIGLQIHGGMGFVEETGAAQHMRDARIMTIYEGTTGIQAIDLIGRKILRDKGVVLQNLLSEIQATDAELAHHGEAVATIRSALTSSVDDAFAATKWLFDHVGDNEDVAGAVSVNFLMLLGNLTGGWQLARSAAIAADHLAAAESNRSFCEAKLVTARFFAEQVLPRTRGYRRAIESGSDATMALTEDQF